MDTGGDTGREAGVSAGHRLQPDSDNRHGAETLSRPALSVGRWRCRTRVVLHRRDTSPHPAPDTGRPGGRQKLPGREATDHHAEGEVESIVALAGGQLGGVAGRVGEDLDRESGEPPEQFVPVEDPGGVLTR